MSAIALDKSLAVVEASLAHEPSFFEAAQKLSQAQYRVALVGPGAVDASEAWLQQGLAVAFASTEAFASTVETLSPAIAVAPACQSIPESVPNRLAWSVSPAPSLGDGRESIHDFSAWAHKYLAPRVPRHFSEQTFR